MMRRLLVGLVALGSMFDATWVWAQRAAPGVTVEANLPALSADINQTSVSGISSGAYMAGQYQFAHGKTVVGAAIIAGGPFGCAEARYGAFLPGPTRLMMNASQSINGCMLNALAWYGIPNAASLAEQARDLAEAGKIDPIAELARQKIYLFSGVADQVVKHQIVVAAAEVYLRLGVPKEHIKTGPVLEAGHGFVTEPTTHDCGSSATPFVVHCGYDQAGDLLAHIYGRLEPRAPVAKGYLIAFDQKPFVEGLSRASMADTGAAYIPSACREGAGCRVHVAFHGCQQTQKSVGDAFVSGTGFAAWADTNRIILLFPQVDADPFVNPMGCWDWWGYTGFDYLTRNAPQVVAVHRMVERLAGKP
ncbi:MAG: poly(3-hydroxybutyrate) depolymerase [Hyphomicrobiaceae bacterium]